MLVLEEDAEAQRVIFAELLTGVRLNAGGEARQPSGIGEAVENHVAHVRIGCEPGLGIADERRDLKVQRVTGILVSGDAVMGDLALVLVELGCIVAADAIDGECAVHASHVRDLEMADEASGEHRDAAGRGEDVGDVSEWTDLRRPVMDGVARRQRVLDPDVITKIAAR